MLPKKRCKHCGDPQPKHWPYQCRQNTKTKKTIKQVGKKTLTYNAWRDNIAKPYLISTFGYKCAMCGRTNVRLDVDHIQKRRMGGAPSRTMNLANVRFLCRDCHFRVT